MNYLKIWLSIFLSAVFLAGCAGAPSLSSLKIGGGESAPISGAAASAGDNKTTTSTGSNELRRCSRNHGRIAIEEAQVNQQMMMAISRSGISSFNPKPLAQHAIMQSACFTVVDRGAGFAMGEQERRIAGETGVSTARHTSVARWGLRVEIPQPTTQTGAGMAGLASMIPGLGGFASGAAAIAGSISFSEAQVMLTVVDLRTSEVVASVTGTGKSTDFGLGGALISGVSGMGGYASKSPEVKVIAAGFVDAINQLVPLMDQVEGATALPETPRAANTGHQPKKKH